MPSSCYITVEHQRVLGKLYLEIGGYLKNKPCEVLMALCDVLLPDEETEDKDSIKTIVQPDIFVVCEESKLQKKHCIGAPDLVIEIISTSTASRDRVEKSKLYYSHGVKEYWIVDLDSGTVEIFTPGDKNWYLFGAYHKEQKLSSPILPGLEINLKDVFDG